MFRNLRTQVRQSHQWRGAHIARRCSQVRPNLRLFGFVPRVASCHGADRDTTVAACRQNIMASFADDKDLS